MADLRGRVIVLAGGSGGLGSATAALLAAEGPRLVIGYHRDTERAERVRRECGGDTVLCQADICSQPGRQALLQCAGDLYGLVVLAGDPARGDGEETFRHSVDVNFLGPTLLARQAAEAMRARATQGAIVLLATMQAVHVFENSSAYAAPKVGLIHAARVLAKECGGRANIRVNVVAPGVTTSGMAEASVNAGKYEQFVTGGTIPRYGRADDVARAIRFFLEPDNYITGQVLAVDGGLTLRRDLCGG